MVRIRTPIAERATIADTELWRSTVINASARMN